MNREEALSLVKKHVKNKNLVKHMLAAEFVLEGLAEHFDEDQEKWSLAGLLHDVDYDQTADQPLKHSLLSAEILEQHNIDPEIIYAVKVHNDAHGFERISKLDKALYSSDPLTGLIVAAALIHPDKKLNSIDPQFVLKRFNDNHFARGANREQIYKCSELGLTLEEFVSIGLKAMQSHHKELGL